jgi:hypothetical protein
MSDLTSVKVPQQTRERLATAASLRGVTIRALLDELSARAVDDALMDQAAEQMRHLRDNDPEAWTDYLREGQSWEEGTVERLDA